MKQLDKSKKSNIKCEHCEFYLLTRGLNGRCKLTMEPKRYWNRCKKFDWAKRYERGD